MSRLDIKTPSRAQTVVEGLYRDVERRIAASPPGLCPVEMSLSFLQLCHAQTCGKCVPCRIGLGQLTKLISQVLDGTANMGTVRIIEKTARSIVDTADCAIGRDAARLVVDGLEGFRDDYEEHVQHHRCLASLQNPVPCVALCPAGVDIPGYMALVGAGRYADAVRLIRKDNPMPTACAYICEHPCEARCRRNMIDDPINIRGLKRYAVDHAGVVPNPPCAPATGKTVAIVGGGPSGLSCAYYLALMGHKVTIFEECSKLGGMLRYGIPSYRFPREKLDAEIDSILSLGIEVRTNVRIGRDIWLEELEKQFNSLLAEASAAGGTENYAERFRMISNTMADLKEHKARIQQVYQENELVSQRLKAASVAMSAYVAELTEWDQSVVYQLVEKVTVLAKDKIRVTFRDGAEVEQEIEQVDWRNAS